jgi:hypothetical protein
MVLMLVCYSSDDSALQILSSVPLALASADLALVFPMVLMIVCYSSDDSVLQSLAAYHWHWLLHSAVCFDCSAHHNFLRGLLSQTDWWTSLR